MNKFKIDDKTTADVVNRIEGKPDNSVVFIFSCPGRLELKNKTLAYGATGTNLEQLLKLLNQEKPDVFKYTEKMLIE